MRLERVKALAIVLTVLLSVGCSEESPVLPEQLAGEHLWSKRFGDAGEQSNAEIAADFAGNIVIAGGFEGTLDFGGDPLVCAGQEDIFVAKFTPGGAHVWSKRFGDASNQALAGIATDAGSNVVLVGTFAGAVDFGGGTLTSAGDFDIFVVKFAPDGSHLWSKRFGGAGYQWARDVAIDGVGNVVVAGDFQNTVDFGGGTLTSAGEYDIFVAKLFYDGGHYWSRRFGDALVQGLGGVAIDIAGNVAAAGRFSGTVDFGGGTLSSAGGDDVFVARLGPSGSHLWSKRFGDAANQEASDIAAESGGNVVVTGSLYGTVDFGGGTLSSAGLGDLFVAKFMSDGSHLWSHRFGDSEHQDSRDVAIDALGNVVVTGYFTSTVNFGGGTLTSAGLEDLFLVKFAPAGSHVRSKRFGDAAAQYNIVPAFDAQGAVVVAGGFAGSIDFGGGTLTSAGEEDIFVAKFRP